MIKRGWLVVLALLAVYVSGCSMLDPHPSTTTTTVTPSTTTTTYLYSLSAQQNTYCASFNPGTVRNTSEVSWVGWSGVGTMESYIQFDVSGLPSTVEILSAKLNLYIDADTLFGIKVYFYNIDTTWDENVLSWENRPSRSGAAVASKEIAAYLIDSWVDIDLTDCVKQWVSGEVVNNGLVIQTNNFKDWNQVSYSSKVSGSNQPKLEISVK